MTIDSFTDEHGFLSNFSPSPIEWRGKQWPTVEHAYQAAKNYDPKSQNPLSEAAVEEIRTADTPKLAKRRGRKVRMVKEWDTPQGGREDQPLKREVMRELLAIKFQDPDLGAKLLATGDVELVEGNWWGDKVWGVCEGEGENWLGLELMALRTKLRESGTRS